VIHTTQPLSAVTIPADRVRRPRKFLRFALAAVAVGALAFGSVGCDDPIDLDGPAAHLFHMLNDYRAANGRAPLTPVVDATMKAQAQAEAMANAHYLYHSNLASGIDPGWYTIGENVGVGPTVDSVENAFIASPDHRANMLSSSFNEVGIGVATSSDGQVWIAEEFVGR
jgi:uncharacterized protein YkwD